MTSRWDDLCTGKQEHDVPVPPVIEPETFGTADEQAPPQVWTPTAWPMRGAELPAFVLRELADGRLAMLVYTSLKEMTDGCGPGQPYVSLAVESVQSFQHLVGADVLLWNPVLAEEVRQSGEYNEGGQLVEYGDRRGEGS